MAVRLVNRAAAPAWVVEHALAAVRSDGELPEELADLFTLTNPGAAVADDGSDVWVLDFADDA